jgi:predicted dehydrogenase
MLDKEKNNIDAVSVSIPDHAHAVPALMAMQMGKHVYVQKPMTHDIYEARMLTEAARKYKVVTQMGNQGSSGDGVRLMMDWYKAGLIGDAHTIRCWTNRPVWPQGNGYPTTKIQYPRNWIGIYGWALRNFMNIMTDLFLLAGAVTGILVPAH